MAVFLARQPIFDKRQNVRGYEIFYRSGFTNHYTGVDADEATSKVIMDTFQILGLDNLTAGKPAFINFSTMLLKEQIATLFPTKYLVIEILESVSSSEEVVENCRQLKAAGYTIVLDDFAYREELEPLLKLADIVKIDLLALGGKGLANAVHPLQDRNITLLAEKVETWEDFRRSSDLGFQLFQGYFFCRPEVITGKRLTPMQLNCLELINKLNHPEFDFNELAAIVSRDLSLSYSLLRLVNSAAFAKRQIIHSIQQALVYLGAREIRKWVTLIALQRMSITKPDAAITTSMVRGRFLEILAEQTKWWRHKDSLFLGGLFSLLDVLLQRPLPEIVKEIGMPAEIAEMVLHGTGPFQDIWDAVTSYERGEWDCIEIKAQKLGLIPSALTEAYLQALKWTSESF